MIERIEPRAAGRLPRAPVRDGMAVCPDYGKPLCEPLSGCGCVAVWCRRCRKHILIKFSMTSESREPMLPS